MRGCKVDLVRLQALLTAYIDNDLQTLVIGDGRASGPTPAFQRVVQRAVMRVQSSGGLEVTGADVLVAIFSERESYAAYVLQQQAMSRFDAVNYISHGLEKGRADAPMRVRRREQQGKPRRRVGQGHAKRGSSK